MVGTLCEMWRALELGFQLQVGKQVYDSEVLEQRVSLVSAALGQRPGRLMVCTRDPAMTIVSLLAGWKAGRRVILMSPDRPAAELTAAVAEGCPDQMLVDTEQALDWRGYLPQAVGLSNLALLGAAGPVPAADCTPGMDLYTSGTTGAPKYVMFDDQSLVRNVLTVQERLRLDRHDVIFCPLSPVLPGVLMMAALPAICAGAGMLFPGTLPPSAVLSRWAESGASVFFGIPYWYELLVNCAGWGRFRAPRQTRLLLTSSAELRPDLFDKVLAATGYPIRSFYCSSEIGTGTFNDGDDITELRRSVGRPVPGVRVTIRTETGDPLPPGEIGRVFVETPLGARGYRNRPDLEAGVFTPRGVATGDMGWLSAGGALYLAGRETDSFKVAGHLVNPLEVEEVICSFPGVREAVVIGVAHQQAGKVPVAEVVLTADASLEQLRQYCRSRLAHYKVPREFRVVDAIRRNGAGKPDRRRGAEAT